MTFGPLVRIEADTYLWHRWDVDGNCYSYSPQGLAELAHRFFPSFSTSYTCDVHPFNSCSQGCCCIIPKTDSKRHLNGGICFLYMLNRTQMTPHKSTNIGNANWIYSIIPFPTILILAFLTQDQGTQFLWLFVMSSIHVSGSVTLGSATKTPSKRSGWLCIAERRYL